ncbi:type II toxin-antitoxin system VapC family toxin [Sandaracinobacteroides saxicola]|uniref:Type II toxin-antitoxin system VapC family toxin n=1 Tax=Sandaracinobacteroides saxicola TaxID=2759707 RepID=A0A7G5IIW6_9SPHN|nr:type II toxin-antitoxin system VapC family toxin [Sandaracinobacteroides saxicola]QMW23308.1 type II toxin-antitoxin system VapC family toxin [Sandaracinobacteroides saxicola]
MRLLLDTHILVWYFSGDQRLAPIGRAMVNDPTNDICVSLASLWEIAIKYHLPRTPRDPIPFSPEATLDLIRNADFQPLTISTEHILSLSTLPWHHRDPFDRLLIAQSIAERRIFLTADAALGAYGPSVLPL